MNQRSYFIAGCWYVLWACAPSTHATPSAGHVDGDSAQDVAPQSESGLSISQSTDQTTDNSTDNNGPANSANPKPRCYFAQDDDEWIDNVRLSTHGRLCRSAMWLDGLFGDEYEFHDDDFRGKVSIGFRQDENDGLDPRLRVKIRTKLPNVSKRFNAFVGRVEEDSFISNTEVDQNQLNTVGLRSVDDDDAEWLVGIGYRNPDRRDNGLDFSVGAKLSSGLNPYAKAAYRHVFMPNPTNFWKSTQTVFWRRDEGFGVSSTLDYIRLIGDKDIFKWDVGAKHTEESEQWEWITSTTWHHSFSNRRGMSSRGYVRGEQENPVSIPEFGVTFSYVRPFLRPWLSLETGVDFRWEKELPGSEYKSATRVGFQFEMLLGDYYDRFDERLRK